VTLIHPPYTDTRGDKRFLGFTTSPSQKNTFSVMTRMGVSAFKKSLAELPIGTEVEVGEIDGRLILPDDKSKHIVFVAGGIGIAPIMGLLRFVSEESWPYNITLIYSNTNHEWAPFLEELTGFAKETQNFKLIATMTKDPQWQGEKRRVNGQFIKEYFSKPEENLYYVTGTPRFVPIVFKEIKDIGVPILNLRMEIFTGY
jgi:predicted ferric reductase